MASELTPPSPFPNVQGLKSRVYPGGRLDTDGASEYLGVAIKTLAMWRSQGKGPRFIKKGRVFYYITDLEDWLNDTGRLQSTSQS